MYREDLKAEEERKEGPIGRKEGKLDEEETAAATEGRTDAFEGGKKFSWSVSFVREDDDRRQGHGRRRRRERVNTKHGSFGNDN